MNCILRQDLILPLQDRFKAIKMRIMKPIYLILFALFSLSSCKKAAVDKTVTEGAIVINSIEVDKNKLTLNQNQGVWYYNNKPFNGFSEKFNTEGTLIEKLGFYNGKREGVARTWSDNRVLRIESYYNQNRFTGVYKSWWENGVLALQVNYIEGNKQGEEKQWYPNGQLSKLRQLVDGKENGIQKAWLNNGKLYVNYEAKNGRIFGMRRANSCYKLEDEKVVKKQRN